MWAAISQTRLDTSLPTSYLIATAVLISLTTLPSALWAGALTPILSTDLQVNGTISIPRYSSRSQSVWASQFQTNLAYNNDTKQYDVQIYNVLDKCTEIHDLRGFVPSCPVPALQGLLLTSASDATSQTFANVRLHSKLDSVSWAYSGRSYGVGASAGITEPLFSTETAAVVAYKYQETGYRPRVECLKNASSDISLGLLEVDDYGFEWYILSGSLSNEPPGTTEWYPVGSWDDPPKLLVWAARSYEKTNMVVVATSDDVFLQFNQTQCAVTFTPTIYNVNVNVTSRTVEVKEADTNMEAGDFEPTGELIFGVVQSLNLLARMSNSLYVSVMGNALQSNVYNMETRLGSNATEDHSVLLAAVEDSYAAMIDDILVAYGASQLLNAQDFKETVVVGQKPAVRIGKHVWIYTALAFNGVLVLVFLAELIRTRFWSGLSQFDYTNIKCTITAASAGGMGIANHIARSHDRQSKGSGDATVKLWDGSPRDPAFEKTTVVLDEGSAASTAKGVSGIGMPALRSTFAPWAVTTPLMASVSEDLFTYQHASKAEVTVHPVPLDSNEPMEPVVPNLGHPRQTKYTHITMDD
ncbi:hypothetical protein H2200_007456 [Cladophialophora chaetospira]|uniref:Uncharacterized protein n=1 Tax=Cladophialophora chaetospira TaxID=386627 RepID=A0AA38X8F5_9EURO|nr:hypothetical protein H2200_007456 [Cladophialophora chaetospira]